MMSNFHESDIDLNQYIRKIERMRKEGDFDSALHICSLLVNNESTCASGLRARANLYADMRKRDLEIADREMLIEVNKKEPADYFDLGISLWRSGNIDRAVEIFKCGLELGEREGFHYYSNVTRMHLVALLITLGRLEEARREGEKIPNGYESYLPVVGVVSKENLMNKLPQS